MLMTKAAKTIMFGSAAAFTALVVAIAIRPEGFLANGGVGYYNAPSTLPLYAIAYLSIAAAYWFADKKGWLSGILKFIAVLFVGLLLTPPQTQKPAHLALASALISFQIVLSLWFAVKRINWIDGLLLIVQFSAGIATLFALDSKTGYLLQLQLIFQLAFTIMLVRALNSVSDDNILSM
jgi:hypothetical protein